MTPRMTVLHDTAGRTTKYSSVDWFCSDKCTTSAHFVVERDGTITQMVRTDRRAYHAGKSKWNGVVGLNSCSVGIEIVNPGKLDKNGVAWFGKAAEPDQIVRKKTAEHGDGYWLPYTDAQIKSVKQICRAIVEEYPDCNEIVTHWMISPGRKIDTNPLFPWEEIQLSIVDPSVEEGESEIIAPPPPVEKPEVKVPSPVKRAAESKTVWAKLSAMGLALLGYIQSAMDWLADKVDWLFGVPAKIKTDVDATLTPIQSLGQLIGANLKVILPTIAIGLIGVAIARHVRDTIEERKAKAELAALKGE